MTTFSSSCKEREEQGGACGCFGVGAPVPVSNLQAQRTLAPGVKTVSSLITQKNLQQANNVQCAPGGLEQTPIFLVSNLTEIDNQALGRQKTEPNVDGTTHVNLPHGQRPVRSLFIPLGFAGQCAGHLQEDKHPAERKES